MLADRVNLPKYLTVIDETSFRISIRLQPKAKKEGVIGEFEDFLRFSVTAPPVKGKANERLKKLLAKLLNISKTNIKIISGELNRNKIVEIKGSSLKKILTALDALKEDG